MPRFAEFPLAAWALAVGALLAAPPARAFQPGLPENRDPEIAAQKRAVADIRNVGTAMFSWLTDQVTDDGQAAETEPGTCVPVKEDEAEARTELYDVHVVPEISWEALRAILVPEYLHELPRNDPWGNPYEYRVDVQNPLGRSVLGIRSAGRDGRFDAEEYRISGFLMEDLSEDLVWADGFFVRWPETPKPEKAPVKK